MSNYVYPRATLPPRQVVAEIVPANTGGGRSITAIDQVVSFDAGYWQIDLREIPLVSRVQKLAWRAMSANLSGRIGIVDVPLYLEDLSPWPLDEDGNPITAEQAEFYDETMFDDGTPFDDATFTVIMNAAFQVPAGATTMFMLASPTASEIEAGMDFSVQGASLNRLYRIESILSQNTTTDGTEYEVSVTPPVREIIAVETVLNFQDPRVSCRLLDDGQMRTGADDYAGRTLASLSFVEALS